MKIIQKEDKSGEIVFSWKERITLLLKGKLILDKIYLKHFGNHLANIIFQWNMAFDEETKRVLSQPNDEVKTK